MHKKNPQKEMSKNFFEKQKKLILLLLLLLIGSISITLAISSLNQEENSASLSPSNSSITTSLSSLPSSSPSSEEAIFNGSEVPPWDLSNPIISTEGISFDLEFDFNFVTQRVGDYLIGIGGMYPANTPNVVNKEQFLDYTIRVRSLITNEQIFEYRFDSGQGYYDYLNTLNSLVSLPNYSQSLGFDEDQYLYLGFRFGTRYDQNLNSIRAGDYLQITDALVAENPSFFSGPVNTVVQVFLRFDLRNENAYTILGLTNSNTNVVDNIQFIENQMYMSHGAITSPIGIYSFDFITLPEVLAPYTVASSFFILVFDIEPNGTLTQLTSKSKSFSSISNASFTRARGFSSSVQQGFNPVSMDDFGRLYFNIIINSNSGSTLTDIRNNIDSISLSFISDENFDAAVATIDDDIALIYEGFEDGVSNTPFFQLRFFGTIDLTTGMMDNILPGAFIYTFGANGFITGQVSHSITILDDRYRYQSNTTVFPGSVEIFESVNARIYEYQGFIVDTQTNTTSEVLSYDVDDFFIVGGLFKQSTGYFLSGTLLEDAMHPSVKKSAAVLINLNDSFTETDRVVLNGSSYDTGGMITLNAALQPIWLVVSSSIDEDFAFASSLNPNQLSRTYGVSFSN
jgi:hypothetical protein